MGRQYGTGRTAWNGQKSMAWAEKPGMGRTVRHGQTSGAWAKQNGMGRIIGHGQNSSACAEQYGMATTAGHGHNRATQGVTCVIIACIPIAKAFAAKGACDQSTTPPYVSHPVRTPAGSVFVHAPFLQVHVAAVYLPTCRPCKDHLPTVHLLACQPCKDHLPTVHLLTCRPCKDHVPTVHLQTRGRCKSTFSLFTFKRADLGHPIMPTRTRVAHPAAPATKASANNPRLPRTGLRGP
jgi:hypothetical protein